MKSDHIALIAPVHVLPVFFLLILIEWIYSNYKNKKNYRLYDSLTNISCGIGQRVLGIWLMFYFIFLMVFLYQYRIFTIPDTWFYGFLLFLGVDLCYYLFHRLSHAITILWAVHVVHHQSEEFNFSVAFRQPWFQAIFVSSFYIPLPLLGFSPEMIATIIAINTLYQFWLHTKLIKKLPRFVEFIFNTPSHHRVHHGVNHKYINRNHGGILIIWDRLFGTFQKEEEEVVYGINEPFRSCNPLLANLRYWKYVVQISFLSKKTNGTPKLYIKPVFWQSASTMGQHHSHAMVPAYVHQKYNPPVSKPLSIYLIVQYAFIIGITSYFMFFGKPIIDDMTDRAVVIQTICLAFYLVFSITSIGLLLESKKISVYMEYGRLIGFGILGLLFLNETYGLLIMGLSALLSLSSIIHYSVVLLFEYNRKASQRLVLNYLPGVH